MSEEKIENRDQNSQRKSVDYAKLKNSQTIHFCNVWDNNHYTSNCGVFSGETKDGRIQVIKDINKNSILCKTCAQVEGNTFNNNKNWFSKKDTAKEIEFKLLTKQI